MKLTPLDIRHQDFGKALQGYRRASVREFLERVSDDMEAVLRERQDLQDRLTEQDRRVEEYRSAEDELRRAVMAAERIGSEVKQNAQREAELLLREAQERASTLSAETEARRVALEAGHRARMADLEGRHRDRLHLLEQSFQQRQHELEAQFAQRRAELQGLLARARGEQAQFLSQYRALVQGFAELAARHELPEAVNLDPQQASPAQVPAAEPQREAPRVEEQQFV